MKRMVLVTLALLVATEPAFFGVGAEPVRLRRFAVASQSAIASRVGADVMAEGGNAIDAAVATAFTMAVTHPTAGNIGGGGFLVFRSASGQGDTYDFRETAPARATATMWLKNGKYDSDLHHDSPLSVGVPGTVAGLHLAWTGHGKLPWRRLVEPAIALARDGFEVTDELTRSFAWAVPHMTRYPASMAVFTNQGQPWQVGDKFKQPDLARTLERIATDGPRGFYEGETARLIAREMARLGGVITEKDLRAYQARKRAPVRGTYRGYEILSMPPISSGGIALVEMLNILEEYDLAASGFHSAKTTHLMTEAMRRAYADRARYLGDPDFTSIPLDRLTSKAYATELRKSINLERASRSTPDAFEWPVESQDTTHFSIVDSDRNAVSMTYTIEGIYGGYGSFIVVPGAGFLLNSEMGDFNAGPGLTTAEGLIGTKPNLAARGKRMLSSMTPTIVARDGALFMVTGSPGGRTIINTVLQTIVNAVDFKMNAQEVVDAGRFHHQWLPDVIQYETRSLSPDTVALLKAQGHILEPVSHIGTANVIIVNAKENLLEGSSDRRDPDGGVAGR
jgi:gamma-glutamyltranspeptidase/glutathione hydrolase